ncbi:MAG: ATP-grasp domain-containing protein, partial [Spirochaetota bacterium]
MNIGITFDLREEYLVQGYTEEETAEFDSPVTIDAIQSTLNDLGFTTERVGSVYSLVNQLAAGKNFHMVFNIAEGMHGIGREAQVPAILDAYGIPYTFSDPCVLTLTLNKYMTKRVIRDMGIPTPDFALVTSDEDTASLNLPYPLFCKPYSEGTGKGITASSLVQNHKQLISVCHHLLTNFHQPVLVERYLPGREFTVGITGTGSDAVVIGVMEIFLLDSAETNAYTYSNKEFYTERVRYGRVDDITALRAADLALA